MVRSWTAFQFLEGSDDSQILVSLSKTQRDRHSFRNAALYTPQLTRSHCSVRYDSHSPHATLEYKAPRTVYYTSVYTTDDNIIIHWFGRPLEARIFQIYI